MQCLPILRSQIDASDRDGRVEPRKKSKSLARSSPDLMITDHQQTSLTPPNSVGRHPGVVMENMINQADTAIRGNMILISRRISARYGLPGARVGEATHPGPPRIRVLLDLASQWSEVPTIVVATSREGDTAHQSPPSIAVASTGEVARVLGQDVPSTVVADVVSESNHGEGSGVREHRQLVLVQRKVESDTDSVRSEPSEMTSVAAPPSFSCGEFRRRLRPRSHFGSSHFFSNFSGAQVLFSILSVGHRLLDTVEFGNGSSNMVSARHSVRMGPDSAVETDFGQSDFGQR